MKTSGAEIKKLMLDRMAENCCPICGAVNAEDVQTVYDEHIALKGEPIKICKTHYVTI